MGKPPDPLVNHRTVQFHVRQSSMARYVLLDDSITAAVQGLFWLLGVRGYIEYSSVSCAGEVQLPSRVESTS